MIFLHILEPLGYDLTVYHEAAWMILRGLNPYLGIISSSFPFNYPPTSILFLWPLGIGELDKFGLIGPIWTASSLLAYAVSLWLVLKLSLNRLTRTVFFVTVFLFTLPFFPVKFNLGNGQINNFLLLFSVLGLYFYHNGRKNLAAGFLAFAIGIKLAPAVFLLYFFIRRDYQQIIRIGVLLLFFEMLSLVLIPALWQLDYWRQVFPLSWTLAAKEWYYNQSLQGYLARSLKTPQAIYLVSYFFTAIFVFVTWFRGRRLSWSRTLAAVACLYLLIHPVALQHYFVFAIIPLILLVKLDKLALLGIAYFLIAMDIKNFALVPKDLNVFLSHQFFGVLILWIMALWGNRAIRVIGGIWVIGIIIGYTLMLLCRGGICF